ncbi:MAG: hypothetical protein AAGG48_14485 [Planctomycetota bacterium]
MLTKEQILQAPTKLKVQVIPVPEWGEGAEVCVRELTGDERDRFEEKVSDAGTLVGARSSLVALGVCDADGNSFEEFTESEVEQLGSKGASAISRLFDAIKKMSGMESESVKEAEKNSPADPSESSG